MLTPATRLVPLVSVLLAATQVGAQVDWVDVTPASGGPGARTGHAMVYDAARGHTLLFGGRSTNTDGTAVFHDDTWSWNGTDWTLRATTGPSARLLHAMAYDPARQRVVLFGGSPGVGTLGDTWEWDGVSWTEVTPANAPDPCHSHAMEYYAPSGGVVLVGGNTGVANAVNGTWSWDGTDWTLLSTATTPGGLSEHCLAFDGGRQALVAFGGGQLAISTYLWDGASWSAVTGLPLPGIARNQGRMVYDSSRDRAVLFGGNGGSTGGYPLATHAWSGVWSDVQPPAGPSGREEHGMAYDSARDRIVIHGGRVEFFTSEQLHGDTWELAPYTPPPPYQQAAVEGFGITAQCTTAFGPTTHLSPLTGEMAWIDESFTVGVIGIGTVLHPPQPAFLILGTSNTMWGATPLPLSMTFLGRPDCFLRVDPVLSIATTAKGGASWTIDIPDCVPCVGADLQMQVLGIETGALVLSNGLTATLGQR